FLFACSLWCVDAKHVERYRLCPYFPTSSARWFSGKINKWQLATCNLKTQTPGTMPVSMAVYIYRHVNYFSGAYFSFRDVITSQKKQDSFLVCDRYRAIDGGTGVVCLVRLFFWCYFARLAVDTRWLRGFLYRWKWAVIEPGEAVFATIGTGRGTSLGLDPDGVFPKQVAGITASDAGHASAFYRTFTALAQSNQ